MFSLPEADRIQVETNHGKVVCTIETYPRQRAPMANAKLISAAPDLLEALIYVSKLTDEGHWGEKGWKLIQKAIAKAASM